MSDSEDIFDEAFEENILSIPYELTTTVSNKSRRVRKSTAGIRKILHNWHDEEIVRLITAVKKRPSLWDVGRPEYKLAKLDDWREIVDELNIPNIEVAEIKNKWANLRVTFKVNVSKLREKKSGQSTNDSTAVSWRFFKQMVFLENNDVRQSPVSTSTLVLPNDASILLEFPETPQPTTSSVEQPTTSSGEQPTTSSAELPTTSSARKPTSSLVGKRKRKEPRLAFSALPHSSGYSSCTEILNTTVIPPMQTTDSNSTYCDHLLAELRGLSPTNARALRRILSHTMWNFLDQIESEESMPQSYPVNFIDQYGNQVVDLEQEQKPVIRQPELQILPTPIEQLTLRNVEEAVVKEPANK